MISVHEASDIGRCCYLYVAIVVVLPLLLVISALVVAIVTGIVGRVVHIAVALWLSLLMPSLLLLLLTKTSPLDNHCQQNLFPHLADFRPFMFDPIKVPKENGVEGIRIQVGLSLLRQREL